MDTSSLDPSGLVPKLLELLGGLRAVQKVVSELRDFVTRNVKDELTRVTELQHDTRKRLEHLETLVDDLRNRVSRLEGAAKLVEDLRERVLRLEAKL